MTNLPIEHGLILSIILFSLGFLGVLIRRNLIFMLMSLEIMFNACGLAFVLVSAQWNIADGQVMYVTIITLTAVEAAIALALVVQLYQRLHSLDVDNLNLLKG